MFTFAVLMFSISAHAAIPADINVTPGSLFIKWQPQAASLISSNDRVEVKDFQGDVIAAQQVNLKGCQVISIPRTTQGMISISAGNENSKMRIPFSLGAGREG